MSLASRPTSQTKTRVTIVEGDSKRSRTDRVITEEPLEIRVTRAGESTTVAVTMRTPGSDFELAVGFLFTEGIIERRDDVLGISYCRDSDLPPDQLYNIVIVDLATDRNVDLGRLERHFHVSSACGVCGKANLDAIALRGIEQIKDEVEVAAGVVATLPDRLRKAQRLFESTGGLHAAGLFTADGEIVEVREDVGRHNAVDKGIGWALLEGRVPLDGHVLVVSGRSSFEILQKAVVARVPVVCSVSAPSSLAVDLARSFGMSLAGFVRGDRFNVYAGEQRFV